MPLANDVSRRGFLGASTGAAAAGLGGGEAQRPASRPKVIVFYTDQQRWDSVGAYGSPMDLTPNLDRMCPGAVRFERAFTTQPVCAPARSTIQTGKYPTYTGVIRNNVTLRDDEADELQARLRARMRAAVEPAAQVSPARFYA